MAARSGNLDSATAALLVLPPLFWAGNSVAARLLVGDISPLQLSALRWALALLLFLPFAWRPLRDHLPALRAAWKDVAWISVLGVGMYNTLLYVALQTSTPISTTLIAASSPVFILTLGALFFGERTRAAQWAGCTLSLVGVLFVMARGDLANLARLTFVAGDLVMLGANLTWTLYTWLLRKRRPQVPFAPLLAAQMLIGLIFILPLAAAEAALGAAQFVPSGKLALLVLYMALFPSIAAYFCWDRGVQRAGAVLPVYFANLTPVFAAALSAVLLAEPPRVWHVAALLLIVAGIHLANRSAATR
jgi:drug/metabolite transporter (DMT)-like permease